jgi:hypothetical protein
LEVGGLSQGKPPSLPVHPLTLRSFFWFPGLLLALCALALRGQEVSREYQLKAIFLYRFAQFVDWPETAFPSPNSPLIIGVLGPDPFGGYLEAAVRNERIRKRRLSVQHFQRSQDARHCQILFISASESERLEKIQAELAGRSILTVGETEGFALRGGMIQFITERNRIRFLINLKAAKAEHLQISSKLLELAEVVSAQKE